MNEQIYPKQIFDNNKKHVFSYSALFWLFMFGSVAGFLIEGVWCIFKKGYWESHTATVWGPFCIVYGIGAVAVFILSVVMKNQKLPIQILAYSAAGAVVEYFSSLFQEICFGSTSWNYSEHFLNIGGRVSLQMALLWGVFGILFIRFLFPPLAKLLSKIEGKWWQISCAIMSVFMAMNLLVTCAAVYRWSERQYTPDPASNIIEQLLDNVYDDEKMDKMFPNMVFNNE